MSIEERASQISRSVRTLIGDIPCPGLQIKVLQTLAIFASHCSIDIKVLQTLDSCRARRAIDIKGLRT